MADARLVKHALFLLALGIGQEVLVYPALVVACVLVLFFTDDVVEHLLLRVHLGVVEGLGQWLFAREPRGDGGYACADGQHCEGVLVVVCGVWCGMWWFLFGW